MTTADTAPTATAHGLLADFSLEMTGKDVARPAEARAAIPAGTRVNVTFLAHEEIGMRLEAARAAKEFGFVPVPHIPARRGEAADHLCGAVRGRHQRGNREETRPVVDEPARNRGTRPFPAGARGRLRPAPAQPDQAPLLCVRRNPGHRRMDRRIPGEELT